VNKSSVELIRDSARRISRYTFRVKERLWMENLGKNMQQIRSGRDVREIPKGKGAAVVVASGPSVKKYRQLETLKQYLEDFEEVKLTVFSCDRALKPCIKMGIQPRYVCTTDADAMIAQFYRGLEPSSETEAIFNATVHPDVLEACPYKRYFYVSIIDDPFEEKSLTRAIHYMTGKTMMASMGNVGANTWNLAWYLQYDPIILLGIDFGYSPETPIEKTAYYKAYRKMAEKIAGDTKHKKRVLKGFYRLVENPETGKSVLVDMNFAAYREMFLPFLKKARCTTINCSPESSLFGEGVVCRDLGEVLEELTG